MNWIIPIGAITVWLAGLIPAARIALRWWMQNPIWCSGCHRRVGAIDHYSYCAIDHYSYCHDGRHATQMVSLGSFRDRNARDAAIALAIALPWPFLLIWTNMIGSVLNSKLSKPERDRKIEEQAKRIKAQAKEIKKLETELNAGITPNDELMFPYGYRGR
jgi:hypothetical protein